LLWLFGHLKQFFLYTALVFLFCLWHFFAGYMIFCYCKYKDFIPIELDFVQFTHQYVGYYDPNARLMVTYGAQFAVNKENIHSHIQEYYENLLPLFDS
jgi:hypothetical protein